MNKIINRSHRYILEIIYTFLAIPVIKILAKTAITPNMITLSNLVLVAITCALLISKKHIYIAAALIFLYYFLDTLDGGLARYTEKTSKFGAKLDSCADMVSYNMLIVCCGIGKVSTHLIVILLVVHNLYSIITTYYMLPNIRRMKNFRRFGLKKYLMDRGIILGMDISLLGFLLGLVILTGKGTFIYKLIIVLYTIDLIYRLLEVWINIYLNNKNEA